MCETFDRGVYLLVNKPPSIGYTQHIVTCKHTYNGGQQLIFFLQPPQSTGPQPILAPTAFSIYYLFVSNSLLGFFLIDFLVFLLSCRYKDLSNYRNVQSVGWWGRIPTGDEMCLLPSTSQRDTSIGVAVGGMGCN